MPITDDGRVVAASAPMTNSTDWMHCMRNGVRWSCIAQKTRWMMKSMLNSTSPGM